MPPQKKEPLLADLLRQVQTDLDALTLSQKDAQAGATHSENKAEGDKDMRATEDSYLARGLAKRVTELQSAVTQLSALVLRSFNEESSIALTALVVTEEEDGAQTSYFVAPVGGGMLLCIAGKNTLVITPASPIGKALMGRLLGDEVTLRTPKGTKTFEVVQLS